MGHAEEKLSASSGLEDIASKSDEKVTLSDIFDSTIENIEMGGMLYEYSFHERKVDQEEAKNNLLVIIPGVKGTGEEHLLGISENLKIPFNSITIPYKSPFNLENYSRVVKEILHTTDSKNIVMLGSSYGGTILHGSLDYIDPQLENRVKGVILEASPLSGKHLTDKIKKRIQILKNIVAASPIKSEDNLYLEIINQLPDDVVPITDRSYSTKVITYENDKFVNNEELIKSTTSPDNVVTLDSGRHGGHGPLSWRKYHEAVSNVIEDFFA